jgi:hypothetical protein
VDLEVLNGAWFFLFIMGAVIIYGFGEWLARRAPEHTETDYDLIWYDSNEN